MEFGTFLMGLVAFAVIAFLIMIAITIIRFDKKVSDACELTEVKVTKLYKGGFQ